MSIKSTIALKYRLYYSIITWIVKQTALLHGTLPCYLRSTICCFLLFFHPRTPWCYCFIYEHYPTYLLICRHFPCKKYKNKKEPPGFWRSAWSLARYTQKQVRFRPNSHVATIHLLTEATGPNFNIWRPTYYLFIYLFIYLSVPIYLCWIGQIHKKVPPLASSQWHHFVDQQQLMNVYTEDFKNFLKLYLHLLNLDNTFKVSGGVFQRRGRLYKQEAQGHRWSAWPFALLDLYGYWKLR